MKKLIITAIVAAFGFVGHQAAATPICEFDSPTNTGAYFPYAHYSCAILVCFRTFQVPYGDVYVASTDDGNPCDLSAVWYSQWPFRLAAWSPSPVLLVMRSTSASSFLKTSLPWSCWRGLCVLYGGVTTVAHRVNALPRVHFRSYVFTMTYW